MDKPPQSLNGRSETGRVGMTGPVIRGRAGRTPLPLMHPQPTFRSPYAAPFEPCLFPLSTCHHAHVPPCFTFALSYLCT